MTHVAVPARRAESQGVRSLAARGLYVGVVLVMTATVLLGFWPFYAGLVAGGSRAHWVIYVHGALASGWMLLLLTQVVLVFRRRVRVHQKLGKVGIYYAVLVLAAGVAVTLVAPAVSVVEGRATLDEAAGFLILPIGDLLLFAGFFGAGIAYRRNRELHKRLMLLAALAFVFPAAARLGGASGPFVVLLIWLFPLFLAMGHDLVTRARVAPVYFLGLAVLLAAFARVMLMESEVWLVVGRRILSSMLLTAGGGGPPAG